jgi:hypothetical protein
MKTDTLMSERIVNKLVKASKFRNLEIERNGNIWSYTAPDRIKRRYA